MPPHSHLFCVCSGLLWPPTALVVRLINVWKIQLGFVRFGPRLSISACSATRSGQRVLLFGWKGCGSPTAIPGVGVGVQGFRLPQGLGSMPSLAQPNPKQPLIPKAKSFYSFPFFPNEVLKIFPVTICRLYRPS